MTIGTVDIFTATDLIGHVSPRHSFCAGECKARNVGDGIEVECGCGLPFVFKWRAFGVPDMPLITVGPVVDGVPYFSQSFNNPD